MTASARRAINGYVTACTPQLVDARGPPGPAAAGDAPPRLLRQPGALPGRPAGRRLRASASAETFYGTGEENQAIEFPAGYGYRVRRDDRWKRRLDVHEPPARPPTRVYLQYTVTVTDEPGLTPGDARTGSASAAPCGKIYSVPGGGGPGAVHKRSRTWIVPRERADRRRRRARPRRRDQRRRRAARCGELLASDARYGAAGRPDLQPLAGAARAVAAQHERADLEGGLAGHPRRPPAASPRPTATSTRTAR